ncbi:hypothetical protein AArcMg_4096 (plasmid) [Natrarchaeobaculum sulfurireducens]|uniref:Uncharacterized protein n=1 Tax=Natrarchaeobaculum sulfurireducens TaxID=2044521 RepID=A0A346PK76_9EURY|nr:hypothetical protein AArcMg_4096 [Natrarchaeobaculum sulfurireducens]
MPLLTLNGFLITHIDRQLLESKLNSYSVKTGTTTGFSGSNPNVAFPAGGTRTILIRTWGSATSRLIIQMGA